MRNYIVMLLAFLGAQVALAVWLFASENSFEDLQEARSLLNIEKTGLTELIVKDDEGEVALEKSKGKWVLKSHPELMIEANKVTMIENELLGLQVKWPVTKTKSSHERFNLTGDNHKKQLVFKTQSGDETTLFFGDAPSFKKLYTRLQDHDEVFEVPFSSYKLSTDLNDWFDKRLLAVDNINEIKADDVKLAKADEQWLLGDKSTKDNETQLDQAEIESYVSHFSRLNVLALAEGEFDASNSISVTTEAGKQYVFSFSSKDDSHFIKRDDVNIWFKLSEPTFEDIVNLSSDKFIQSNNEDAVESVSE